MRHHVSLFLTVSFLFLSHGVQGSTINNDDDNGSVAQGDGTMMAVTAAASASSTSGDLQCYRVTLGKKQPLFDKAGKWLDRRAQEANSATMSSVEKDGKKLWTSVLSGLAHHVRVAVMEYLQDDPHGQLSLMSVSQGFRRLALVLPERYDDTASTGTALKQRLLTVLIGGQTGGLYLLVKDGHFKALQTLSLPDLQDAFASRHYNGTTMQLMTYRSTGSKIEMQAYEQRVLNLNSKHLRLVSLNFPEAYTINVLDLSNNQLKVVPDLSHLTKLWRLDLSNNQLKVVPDLSHLTKLEWLKLSNNQLKVVPDISHLTKLWRLGLSHNQLKVVPDIAHLTKLKRLDLNHNQLSDVSGLSRLSRLTNLEWFYGDVALCQDKTVQESIRILNKSRGTSHEVQFYKCSTTARGVCISEKVPLD